MQTSPLANLPRIPIAIVGLRFGNQVITRQLISGPGSAYFDVVGICDMDRKRSSEISAALGLKVYADLEEILGDPTVPAIGLYSGPSGRAELLRKIIRAGKDVMTTKPLELDPEAVLLVLREARALGRVIHLNSPAPVAPADIAQIVSWRSAYDLGTAVGCRADTWANYSEQADGTWYDDPGKCPVAPIFRLGIYLINDLVAIFGKPEEVQVFASRLTTGRPTPDTAQIGIRFANGGLANIFSSFCVMDADPYRNSLVLNFQRGTVYRNSGPCEIPGTGFEAMSELSLVIEKEGGRFVAEKVRASASGQYRWDLFHQALRGERIAGELPPDQIVDGLRVIRAMAEALRTGRSVRVEQQSDANHGNRL